MTKIIKLTKSVIYELEEDITCEEQSDRHDQIIQQILNDHEKIKKIKKFIKSLEIPTLTVMRIENMLM